MSGERRDVVVIGAGLGGLACATRLAMAGASVLVVDKQPRAGGCAGAFRRGAFEHELSLSLLDAVGPGEPNQPLLDELGLGASLELRWPAVLQRELWPEHDLRIPSGIEPWRALMTHHFPAEQAGLEELVRLGAELHARYVGSGAASAAPLEPAGGKGPADPGELARQSAAALVGRAIGDARLRAMMAHFARAWLGIELPALCAPQFLVPWYSYHAFGGSYPKGGSAALVDALVTQLRRHGGQLELGRAAARVIVKRRRAGGVVLADGREVRAPVVVSNGSPPHTLGELVAAGELDARYLRRLADGAPSMSCVKLWLGLAPPLPASLPTDYDVVLFPSYEPGPDPLDPWRMPLSVVRRRLLTAHGMPADGDELAITMNVPPEAWHTASLAHPALGEEMADALVDRMERTLVPGLRSSISARSVATPDSFARRVGSPMGCIFGWQLRVGRTQGWRVPAQTPIDGLWLVGAGTWPGPGVTSVLRSGCATALAILGRSRGRLGTGPLGEHSGEPT